MCVSWQTTCSPRTVETMETSIVHTYPAWRYRLQEKSNYCFWTNGDIIIMLVTNTKHHGDTCNVFSGYFLYYLFYEWSTKYMYVCCWIMFYWPYSESGFNLPLQAEGVEHEYNSPTLIELQEKTTFFKSIPIDLPPGVVPGSQRARVTVVGKALKLAKGDIICFGLDGCFMLCF